MLAREQEELSDFQLACIENDIPFEIHQVFQSGGTSNDHIDLTVKQREILMLAYKQGYFGMSRNVTITELSNELGISPQAVSKRLRRGLQSVISDVLTEL